MPGNIIKRIRTQAMGDVRNPDSQVSDEQEQESVKSNFSMFDKIINFFLLATILLTPLLFLPISSEVREFNKQALLFLMVVIVVGVWIVKVLTTRALSWTKTSLDYIVLAFLGIYLLTSLFSIDKVSSFLGYYGRFTGSFLSLLSLVIFYFLIVNNVKTQAATRKIIKYLSISSGIVLLFSLLQLLGIYLLPFDFAKVRSFNPVGSLVALSIFAAIVLVMAQWLWMVERKISKLKNILLLGLTVIGLIIMFLVNAFIAWLILALGMIAFMMLGIVLTAKQSSAAWFWKPMLVLVISILFVAFQFLPQVINPRNLIRVNLPIEIQLSNATTFNLVKNSVSAGAKQAILGTGPGTTGLAFGEIKPEALNKTVVWNLNFDRASSELANIIIETGILGLLAFEITALLFLIYALYFLFRQPNHPGRMYAFGFFLIWLVLYLTHFLYFFNTTFYFLYWLAIASFMATTHWPASTSTSLGGQESETEDISLSFSSSPRSALSWMFLSLIVLAIMLVGAFFQAAVYVAEASYTLGLKTLNQSNPDFEKVAGKFARAVQLNQYRDVYYLAYGQGLIFLSSKEAAKPEPNVNQIQAWLADSVRAGLQAARISPAKASNWSALAQFYANIKPLGATGTDDAIINSWQEAIKRDPKNPSLQIRLAQAYSNASEILDPRIAGSGPDSDQDGLADSKESELGSDPKSTDSNSNGVSDGDEVKAGFNPAGAGRLSAAQITQFTRIDQSKLIEAEKALNKAIELKGDLPEAYIELARIFEKSNKLSDAKKKLDEAAGKFPGNADIKYEQGRIAYNQKNYLDAEKLFNAVIALVPNHANAHYSLGLVYQQKGDRVKALEEFKKTREITGPNVDLEKLINTLESQAPPKK